MLWNRKRNKSLCEDTIRQMREVKPVMVRPRVGVLCNAIQPKTLLKTARIVLVEQNRNIWTESNHSFKVDGKFGNNKDFPY